MSERNKENDEANEQAIGARTSADLRYLARTSPPIPDALMQEAQRIIEADRENARQWISVAGIVAAEANLVAGMHGDALSSWTASGKGILRPHQRRQRRVDCEMAREYLACRIANPLQPVAKTRPLQWRRAAACPFSVGGHRIRLLADALLRHSTLSGE
jgi:hypothetical protein